MANGWSNFNALVCKDEFFSSIFNPIDYKGVDSNHLKIS